MRVSDPVKLANIRSQSLYAAARMFLEQGYTQSTVRHIAQEAGVNVTAMIRQLGSKENILCELVSYVLEGQFDFTMQMLEGVTEDPVLFYAAETVLQLYMAESSENVRDLYNAAYSMTDSSELIRRTITAKLPRIFGAYLPDATEQDLYEREIASGGVIRSYMTVTCDETFTMERKVRRFLEISLGIYNVPREKIEEAIAFVGRFDYPTLAREVVAGMLQKLEQNGGLKKN